MAAAPTGGLTDNALYYGDCLDWMRGWDAETVDLIYLDPPFNSNADYNMLYAADGGGDAQFRAFTDTWSWDDAAADRTNDFLGAVARPAHNAVVGLYRMLGECGMLAYLTYMAERLEECHRLLKGTGSIYLHCDPTASHYLKALMDGVFGPAMFRNEIAWKRSHSHNSAKRYGPVHDVILFYSVSDAYHWSDLRQPYDTDYIDRYFKFDDDDGRGRYWTGDLTGSGTRRGETGLPWRGFDPNTKSRHWGVQPSVLDQLDADNRIYWPPTEGAWPKLKRYLSEAKGVPLQDLICDIRGLSTMGAPKGERLGYQTQKPADLLRRFIEASSGPGDLVLDPFCGCGTTIAAARSLDRRWAGIDISSFAVDVMLERLGDRTIAVYGIPQDLRSAKRLARDDPFGFETWAVNRLAGFVPNTKQVADGGIDGRATLALQPDDWDSRLALAQVKGGKHSASQFRDFCGVTESTKAAVGCYITLTPVNTEAARSDAAGMGKIAVSGEPYRRMNLWSIADYFDDRRPHLPPMNNPYTGKPIMQASLF